jgi:hypothetical protein
MSLLAPALRHAVADNLRAGLRPGDIEGEQLAEPFKSPPIDKAVVQAEYGHDPFRCRYE